MQVYFDTSAILAITDPREGRHQEAAKIAAGLAKEGARFVVGWHTLFEFADGYGDEHGQAAASRELDRLVASSRVRVVSSEAHAQAARTLLRERPNWDVDLSDCLSFVLMREHGIRRVFTFDSDFRKAGFEVVP